MGDTGAAAERIPWAALADIGDLAARIADDIPGDARNPYAQSYAAWIVAAHRLDWTPDRHGSSVDLTVALHAAAERWANQYHAAAERWANQYHADRWGPLAQRRDREIAIRAQRFVNAGWSVTAAKTEARRSVADDPAPAAHRGIDIGL